MAMTLEEIHEMWERDCIIDDTQLDQSSVDTAKLHGKYLSIHSMCKMLLKKSENNHKTLLKNKFLYYNGKLSKNEIDALGWEYDPFNGLKILKGDMSYYYESDIDIQNSESKMLYQREMIHVLEEILTSLKWRNQTIRNIIDWKRFTSGV
jgi:hypothetical protein